MPFPETALLNAFRPGKALDEPSLFAGRRDQVIALGQNLHADGVCPIIYGARGLGKSSLALQAQRIAIGDVTLLQDYGEPQWAFGQDDAYLAFYVPCSASMQDTRSILQGVINSFRGVTIKESTEPNQLVDRTTTRRFTLKFIQTESQRRYQLPDKIPAYDRLEVDEQLLAIASRLSDAYGRPILVIIDELDLVRDTSGLASFIKNASSSSDLKFILVGIGQNVSDLLSDHQSIERIIVPVQVPRMDEDELLQIIDRAMVRLSDLGLHFRFDRSSSLGLVRLASGYPWFVHLLGQEALLTAHHAKGVRVIGDDVQSALKSLAKGRLAPQFRERHQKAVRDSPKREMVLRALAIYRNQDIPTSDIYPVLRRLGIPKPSTFVRDLSADKYGCILVRPSFQERGALRFENEMFKVYVRISDPIFNIHEQLRQAWRAEFRGTQFAEDAEPIVPV